MLSSMRLMVIWLVFTLVTWYSRVAMMPRTRPSTRAAIIPPAKAPVTLHTN